MDNILTLKEAADLLRVEPKTLYRLIRQGKIPVHKIGRNYRFNKLELMESFKIKSLERNCEDVWQS